MLQDSKTGLVGNGETVQFEDTFTSNWVPTKGWTWIREDKTAWSSTSSGLELVANAGTIWPAHTSSADLSSTMLLRSLGDVADGVEVELTNDAKLFGEQAGLWLYKDDENWVKWVSEGMKDGSVKLVFASKIAGKASMICKVPLPGNNPEQPVILRLELLDGKVSAVVDRKVCLQHIATTDGNFLLADNVTSGFQVAIACHGGDGTRSVAFRRFATYAIADGRGRLGPSSTVSP